MPVNCTYRVTSLKGEHILHERVSTPRLAVILNSRRIVEQEKESEETCADAWKNWKGTQLLESEEM